MSDKPILLYAVNFILGVAASYFGSLLHKALKPKSDNRQGFSQHESNAITFLNILSISVFSFCFIYLICFSWAKQLFWKALVTAVPILILVIYIIYRIWKNHKLNGHENEPLPAASSGVSGQMNTPRGRVLNPVLRNKAFIFNEINLFVLFIGFGILFIANLLLPQEISICSHPEFEGKQVSVSGLAVNPECYIYIFSREKSNNKLTYYGITNPISNGINWKYTVCFDKIGDYDLIALCSDYFLDAKKIESSGVIPAGYPRAVIHLNVTSNLWSQ